MKNRKYISEKPVFQYADGSGLPFACQVFAENTELSFIERLQGHWRFNGDKGQQIIFTIKFKDIGLSSTSKAKDCSQLDNEWIYVKYALDLMEDSTYEEFYKVALLITKNRLKRSVEEFEKDQTKFNKTGFWPWPTCTDVKGYQRSNDLYKKVYESIDITEKDLKYFKEYKKVS